MNRWIPGLLSASILLLGLAVVPDLAGAQQQPPVGGPGCEQRGKITSTGNQPAKWTLQNRTQETMYVYWINYQGQEVDYQNVAQPLMALAPGDIQTIQANVGSVYSIWNQNRTTCLSVVTVNTTDTRTAMPPAPPLTGSFDLQACNKAQPLVATAVPNIAFGHSDACRIGSDLCQKTGAVDPAACKSKCALPLQDYMKACHDACDKAASFCAVG